MCKDGSSAALDLKIVCFYFTWSARWVGLTTYRSVDAFIKCFKATGYIWFQVNCQSFKMCSIISHHTFTFLFFKKLTSLKCIKSYVGVLSNSLDCKVRGKEWYSKLFCSVASFQGEIWEMKDIKIFIFYCTPPLQKTRSPPPYKSQLSPCLQ